MPLAAPNAQAPQKKVIYTDEETAAIAAFVASLAPGPQIPTDEEINYEDADLVEGGELFRTNCSQCHNFTGAGGALSNGAYAPDLRDATPRQIYEAMLTGPENMPVFSNETLRRRTSKQSSSTSKTWMSKPVTAVGRSDRSARLTKVRSSGSLASAC